MTERANEAIRKAKEAGQTPFRFSLTTKDFQSLRTRSFRGVQVCEARSSKASYLWVKANDGQLGSLLAVAI